MPIITIDGNIGCGKSSCLDFIHTHYSSNKCAIIKEPVDKWMPLLEKIYCHDTGHFELQMTIMKDRGFIQDTPNKNKFIERSMYFTVNVFVQSLVETNNGKKPKITNKEHKHLLELYNSIKETTHEPNLYVYIRTPPEKCMERIKIRNRQFEDHITYDYIELLHNLHEKAFEKAKKLGLNVLLLDGSESVEKLIEQIMYNIDMNCNNKNHNFDEK